jgi:type IV pilus assembly protein PilV
VKIQIRTTHDVLLNQNRQAGFSLIEVMVAAVILSIGILGVASLQIISMKGTQQSYMKQQAVDLVHSLSERMRSNKEGVINDNYLLADSATIDCDTPPPSCSTGTANCSAADIATVDKHNIVCGYKAAGASKTGGVKTTGATDIAILSEGTLNISCPNTCPTGDVRISVEWREREFGEEDQGPKDSIVVNTRILP